MKGESINSAGLVFEKEFMSRSLEKQIALCDHHELIDFFKRWLPDNQPIPEAGCGSGRWVAWFVKNGWQATGLDWSEVCCTYARQAIPGVRFEVGDMRSMPFENGEFGAIISVGSVEHTPEGPLQSLREYYRVLRPNGIAIIMVPCLGLARKWVHMVNMHKNIIAHNHLLRHLLGKKSGTRAFSDAKNEVLHGYATDFMMTDLGWDFYQYNFSKKQKRVFLHEAGFNIAEECVLFGDEGILHNFGRIAGTFDYEMGVVPLSVIGKALRHILPLDLMGHMLCYLVSKESI